MTRSCDMPALLVALSRAGIVTGVAVALLLVVGALLGLSESGQVPAALVLMLMMFPASVKKRYLVEIEKHRKED